MIKIKHPPLEQPKKRKLTVGTEVKIALARFRVQKNKS